ncbi:MAG TPA: MFS transporter, partial [Nitrospirales bacterium]|nr:MFS transporter [Nitrospirales bacterium]
GVGALAAAFRHAHRENLKGLGRAIAMSIALLGTGMIALAVSTNVWLSSVALVGIGYGLISTLAGINIMLQSLVPDALRGRVVSFFVTLSLGVTVFGSLWAGIGARYLGAPVVIALGGAALLLTAARFAWALPTLRGHVRSELAAQAVTPPPEEVSPTR